MNVSVNDQQGFVIRGAHVYDHEHDTDHPPIADVVVRDGRIVAIEQAPSEQHADLPAIQLERHLLVPGFVNAHFHSHDALAKGVFETLPLERWSLLNSPVGAGRPLEEVRLRTMVAAIECIRNGITTIQDFATIAPMQPEYVEALIAGYAAVGIRVVLSVSLRDQSQLQTLPWADEMIPAELRELFDGAPPNGDQQLAFVGKQMDHITLSDRVTWAVSPSSPQRCTFDFLSRIAKFAESRDLRIFTHVNESKLQRLLARSRHAAFKGSEIDYLEAAGLLGPQTTMAHGIWLDSDELAKIGDHGSSVVLNLFSNLKLRSGFAPLTAYRQRGIPLALGSDSCSCGDMKSMTESMRLYCLLGAATGPDSDRPTAAEAVRLATIGGANALGMAATLGQIKPGLRADMVAVDLRDPAWQPFNSAARQLVFTETGRGVRHVWVGGQQVVRDGRCTLIDEAKVQLDVEAIMPAVRSNLHAFAKKVTATDEVFRRIYERASASDQRTDLDRYLPNL